MPFENDKAGDIDRRICSNNHPYEEGEGKVIDDCAAKEVKGCCRL